MANPTMYAEPLNTECMTELGYSYNVGRVLNVRKI